MILSLDAITERMWGQYPSLRKVLEEKNPNQGDYVRSSVSDNIFDSSVRLLKMAILVRDNADEILENSATLGEKAVNEELWHLEDALKATQQSYENFSREVQELRYKIQEKNR